LHICETLTLPEGGDNFLDVLRTLQLGRDPQVLVEWSDIIERKANDACHDSVTPIKFKGAVNDQDRFVLDVGAPSPNATVCLLEAIENCLDFMPSVAKEFYAALMDALASDADKRDKAEEGS